jgi:two-component sensor histidine kinase
MIKTITYSEETAMVARLPALNDDWVAEETKDLRATMDRLASLAAAHEALMAKKAALAKEMAALEEQARTIRGDAVMAKCKVRWMVPHLEKYIRQAKEAACG